MGQTGPLATFAGFGNLAAAITGFSNLGGWPDRPPAGPVRRVHRLRLAALHRRRDPGRARSPPADRRRRSTSTCRRPRRRSTSWRPRSSTTRRTAAWQSAQRQSRPRRSRRTASIPPPATTAGSRSRSRTTRSWRRLCDVMERPDLAARRRASRRAPGVSRNATTLDALVAAWTKTRDAERSSSGCCRRAACRRASSATQPRARARPAARSIASTSSSSSTPSCGTTSSRARASRSRARRPPFGDAAPTLGRDNQYVLETILGYDEERDHRARRGGRAAIAFARASFHLQGRRSSRGARSRSEPARSLLEQLLSRYGRLAGLYVSRCRAPSLCSASQRSQDREFPRGTSSAERV